MNHRPLAFPFRVKCDEPSTQNKTGDSDRLREALKNSGLGDVAIPLEVMRRLPSLLREQEHLIDLVLASDGNGLRISDLGQRNVLGLALDLGTTTFSCSLYDLSLLRKLGSFDGPNPQAGKGTDVLTRVQKSMIGEFEGLRDDMLEGVNSLIAEACRESGKNREDIFAMTVSGNTIMSHFLLGLDVTNIPISPFVPAANAPIMTKGAETGVLINPEATVYVFPNAGSYVGGDIISGLLSAGVHREESPVLFIDVGTNAEIALGCREWIMVGAGAAGPALEDGVAAIGRQAGKGSIAQVEFMKGSGRISCEVIGGGEPDGICGSGMVDLVAALYSGKVIDSSGKYDDAAEGVIDKNGEKAYVLHSSDSRELAVTEREIGNFLRTKAAMFAFISVFTRAVGLRLKDVNKIYIAGALGCGINLENAVLIGMLPDLPRERFIPVGNSSLKGAEMLLCNRDLLPEIERLRGLITYREMGEESELLNILQGGMFIPHTEPALLKG